jgi:hypothetical protein
VLSFAIAAFFFFGVAYIALASYFAMTMTVSR